MLSVTGESILCRIQNTLSLFIDLVLEFDDILLLYGCLPSSQEVHECLRNAHMR